MASTPKTESVKAAEPLKAAIEQTTDMTQRASDNVRTLTQRGAAKAEKAVAAAGETQRELAETAQDQASDLGRTLTDLLRQQAERNIEAMTALYGTVDWEQVVKAVDWKSVARIQADFLRESLARTAELSQHWLEASQSMMASTATIIQRQAKKAA